MLGVEGYGSDSDSESVKSTYPPSQTSLPPKLPGAAKKSSFTLPPPSNARASSSSGLSLPPPKTKKAPKKIAIGLPALSRDADGDRSDSDERPAAKKPRLESGAGASALLSMLPAPKNKEPILEKHERVLGGGRGPGLVFKSAPSQPSKVTTVEEADEDEEADRQDTLESSHAAILEEKPAEKPALPFMPTSVARGKANVSVEEKHSVPIAQMTASSAPAIDFFSLGSSSQSYSHASSSKLPSVSAAPVLPGSVALSTFSAAPKVKDFVPPEPTPEDPYPGYYLKPSGEWAAYDTDYYQKFYNKWKKEYDAHVRALEKGTAKGFERAEEEAEEVNALKEMEKAKAELQEREARKALTTAPADAPAAPKMNIKGAGLSGRARTRGQLSTLLAEAYSNREALEEKIAQGRRNRKEAGNKYGRSFHYRMNAMLNIF
ncbi:mitotic checkpoint regulator, MAD2B-interacting-domain-containing protein [Epithele typhae]|uniref:mitotic checkpoint regulator, MAD2B-interacting-domain-containing protein n=1 Tax=Epithele typhae TaxID=378194 RepID=UPI0020076F4C|nr:mitotic checkpoint regulator, MAD2B-interacting-domain-containing protein [Epithele typhae]KAH9946078.1 mitotic checkpoint regulator, MAD2B-interacting-domain-containing protein [Epithele typhae]